MVFQTGKTLMFMLETQSFSNTSITTISTFSKIKELSISATSLNPLLTKPTSTSYTWNPSRTGFFYFAFNNGSSNNSCNQKYSQKLPIKVSPAAKPPATAPFPAPNSGGGRVPSSPAGFPWPFPPRETAASSPAPEPSSGGVASSPMTVPTMVPGDKSNGIPFINSNPAVPLPTGEVDSATIRPFSPSSSGHHQQVAVGLPGGAHLTVFTAVMLLL